MADTSCQIITIKSMEKSVMGASTYQGIAITINSMLFDPPTTMYLERLIIIINYKKLTAHLLNYRIKSYSNKRLLIFLCSPSEATP